MSDIAKIATEVFFGAAHTSPKIACHHVLGKPHPDRAKQFMPYDALKGFRQLIAETIAQHTQYVLEHPDCYTQKSRQPINQSRQPTKRGNNGKARGSQSTSL